MSEQEILDINELLKASSAYKASDLHIKVGNPPILRVDGRLHPMPDKRRVTQEDVMKIGYSVMNDAQKEKFKRSSEIDIALQRAGTGKVPGQRFPAAWYHWSRLPPHSCQDPDPR
jgi:twitching motility protein PilT